MIKRHNLLTVLVIFLMSCSKSHEMSGSLQKTVLNHTSKIICNFMNTDAGNDSLYSVGDDSVSMIFVVNQVSESQLLNFGNPRPPRIHVIDEFLYNLTDTTCFSLLASYDNIYEYNMQMVQTKNDSIYLTHLYFNYLLIDNVYQEILDVKLVITDKLLQNFQKDYTMLTRFKEYYNQ